MADDQTEVLVAVVKLASKQAVKQGSAKVGIPDDVAKMLADQLSFTISILKTGAKLTPGQLSLLLASKYAGLGSIATAHRYDCAIAVIVLGCSLAKTTLYGSVSGPGSLLVTAADLLAATYSMDQSCGVSEVVKRKVEDVALPAYLWLDQGVTGWLSRGY
jgi:hypothetical protein